MFQKILPDSLTQYIVLIEEVKNYNQNNLNNSIYQFQLQMCNKGIFRDQDIRLIINDKKAYACKFSDIEEYNEINKIITCVNNEIFSYDEIKKLYVDFV